MASFAQCQAMGLFISDVEEQDWFGDTALIKAALEGNIGHIKLLLEAGASIHTRDKYEETALHKASWNGHLEVVKLLGELGGCDYVTAKSNYGYTALHKASWNGHMDVAKYLVEKGGSGQIPTHDKMAFFSKGTGNERQLAEIQTGVDSWGVKLGE